MNSWRNAYLATGDPQTGVQWLLELAAVAPDPVAVLTDVINVAWIPATAREPFYQRLIPLLQERGSSSQGFAKDYADQELHSWQEKYARYLVEGKQFDRAEAVLQSLPVQDKPSGTDSRATTTPGT